MIWIILLIFAVLASLYLIAPLLPARTREAKLRISVFIALFIGASLGTYNLIGSPKSPKLASVEQAEVPFSSNVSGVTPEQITAMVEGLATRLTDNPEDPEGWTRLLRSRIVLGDIPQLVRDHKTMAKTYETRPEILAQISKDSGFDSFAARLLTQP